MTPGSAPGLVVAVTRPEPQASGTVARLAERGFSPVPAPLLEAVAADPPGAADGIGALALTSRTAALMLAPFAAFHRIPVYAVGTATAREARRAGFETVADAAGTVDDLVARLADAPGLVVHMAGEQHTGDLVERLVAAGRPASRRIVYSMAPRTLPAVERVDVVLLFSPRTAHVFVAEATAPPWSTARLIAMSDKVAAVVAGRAVTVAAAPTEAAMLAALTTGSGERR
ncbi:uroporphyrinogen-III synthase [Acuticoccus sp. I52.16.1]|uniref:uroporphyrinogen-III synthase n=1 Tax=Acuticoccus sp. I52.16.1 TaxID=2928472 RepID=UPI001FD24054|nr:uroporphyrinogen-III synthase [Acuticoccus sp. I52.16.1]UOM32805.1 uroporphyrinogen-III synthase [Acuticoccus sp. I52.16.1]